jgi:hypothetical protein
MLLNNSDRKGPYLLEIDIRWLLRRGTVALRIADVDYEIAPP